ncbi:hypothetical protein ACYOEI_30110 [Singulisphaera rosea]
MKTPRPHARTRRAAASLVIAAAGLISLAGCDPRTILYFLQPLEPTVPAPGPSLKHKKVAIVTHAVSGAMGDFPSLDHDLTREFASILRKRVKKIEVVDVDKIWTWMDGHPNWTDPAEVGKAFEADVVIFLEVEAFQVASPSSPGLLEGTARTHIQAFEMEYPKNSKDKPITDQPKEANNIYDQYCDSAFPVRGPVQEGAGVSRSAFKNKFRQVVATELTWHFVEHSPEDDIQDVKFK